MHQVVEGWWSGKGVGGRVEENVKVEGDIFSGCNVGPWQFCHACFSQDLCPTVPPFNGGASCLLHGYYRPDAGGAAPRRSTSYRPITVWPFRQRDAAHEIPEASPTTTTMFACRLSVDQPARRDASLSIPDIISHRISSLSRNF